MCSRYSSPQSICYCFPKSFSYFIPAIYFFFEDLASVELLIFRLTTIHSHNLAFTMGNGFQMSRKQKNDEKVKLIMFMNRYPDTLP